MGEMKIYRIDVDDGVDDVSFSKKEKKCNKKKKQKLTN